ncbi:MAG: diaminopimelate decarboxylase [Pseudomonadales bacterium]
MTFPHYQSGVLHGEDVPLPQIAEQFGTPCYVYSRSAIEQAYSAYEQALTGCEHLICYAVKANSNLAVLNVLARMGSGFDVVSSGELERVLAAGGSASKVVFSGVGKTRAEMRHALEAGIFCFNIESEAELHQLQQVASELQQTARISLRVNPDVDAKTHPYISTGLSENKFGIACEAAKAVYRAAADLSHIEICGIDCHIGSQLTETAPFLDALDRLLMLVDELANDGITIHHIDIGGGLGVCYEDEQPPTPQEYLQQVRDRLGERKVQLLVEPGRSIVANAGVLVTSVLYLKSNEDRHFAIVDAAMNDMIRPALYQAWLGIDPVLENAERAPQRYDVVGPICETADFLAKDRTLAIQADDLLAVRSCGAYGFVMSSNYNSRGRAAEVMVDGKNAYLVRAREDFAHQIAGEALLPGSD